MRSGRPFLARPLAAFAVIVVALASNDARGANGGPVLHEPIPPDPAEDARLGVAIDGDLPAALDTSSGVVSAPDPRRPPQGPRARGGDDTALVNAPPNATFRPDRDTKRPDVVPYDDPFTPSTAPFKRLLAFDTVSANYTLSVRDPRLLALPSRSAAAADGSDDSFFADLVVDLAPNAPQRIPSVGPGTKIVRARAGVGSVDVPVRFLHDGADNWFVTADVTTRARLVMELAIPRAAFGGELGEPSWGDLPKVAPLPPSVARAAAEVAARIGVSRALAPHDAVTKLVTYFRGFVDSDQPPIDREDVYLDLALSKKGVCRHRAFAFLVTALGLGLPTRMIANEAHAWIEVNDGAVWRRIDLGGAGRAMDAPLAGGVKHEAPPDPFAWPPNATRGEELADRARASSTSPGSSGVIGANGAPRDNANASPGPSGSANGNAGGAIPGGYGGTNASAPGDDRPASRIALALVDSDAHRGAALRVHGEVSAEGSACAHLLVEIGMRDGKGHEVPLGAIATDEDGKYEGALVVPQTAALGDYDVFARTSGDARCGRGGGP